MRISDWSSDVCSSDLSHIHIGMPATIHIMGEVHSMQGHVQSLSAGIEDRERTTASGTLLANVNPTFSWVRLAQRIPVRIAIAPVPQGMALITGRTPTIVTHYEERRVGEKGCSQCSSRGW